MNERVMWKEVVKENRGTILVMSAVSLVLLVVTVVLAGINGTEEPSKSQNGGDSSGIVDTIEKEEASESELGLDLYINEIHDTLRATYRSRLDGYEIARGKLLEDGTWYVTELYKPVVDQWSLPEDTYKIVMRKLSGVWKVVAGPDLILSYGKYPDIPEEILVSANNL